MSKAKILARLRESKEKVTPLPSLEYIKKTDNLNLKATFKEQAVKASGKILEVADYVGLNEFIQRQFGPHSLIFSGIPELASHNLHLNTIDTNWENLDVAILKGQFGVAENGAIWLTDDDLQERMLPFICKTLVLVIHPSELVSNMHQAYERIEGARGFGIFISGPSKTADIEQSLVIGAQGPLEHIIILCNSN